MDGRELTLIMRYVFLLERYWEGLLDSALRPDGLTAKQLFLLAVIDREFEGPPAISEAADRLLTSHQNIKQMALALQRRGFVRIEPDPHDRRTQRIHITESNYAYWRTRDQSDARAVANLFAVLSEDETRTLQELLARLVPYTAELYKHRGETDLA